MIKAKKYRKLFIYKIDLTILCSCKHNSLYCTFSTFTDIANNSFTQCQKHYPYSYLTKDTQRESIKTKPFSWKENFDIMLMYYISKEFIYNGPKEIRLKVSENSLLNLIQVMFKRFLNSSTHWARIIIQLPFRYWLNCWSLLRQQWCL